MIPTVLQNTAVSDSCLKEATTSNNNDTNSRKRKCKRVTFGQVLIIEFNRTIGDNPTTITGVPIALGHQVVGSVVYDLDQYESLHKRPRSRMELKLCPQVRFQMALQSGATLQEIEATYIEMVKIQKDRAESFPNWLELVGLGLDVTYHPTKLSKFRARKSSATNIVSPSPSFVGGWGSNGHQGMQSAEPIA